jgi:hypothetical protein
MFLLLLQNILATISVSISNRMPQESKPDRENIGTSRIHLIPIEKKDIGVSTSNFHLEP